MPLAAAGREPGTVEPCRALEEPPGRRVRWPQAHRILPSRYPPIQLFERLADDPAEWEMLAEIESLTNPRLRDEIGDIRMVSPAERVSGPGASWVMASFTHLNPNGSRFSEGGYGVYYAARELPTAIAETVFHLGKFYAATGDPPHVEAMRVLTGKIDANFHDLRGDAPAWAGCLDPDDYTASRTLGRRLRELPLSTTQRVPSDSTSTPTVQLFEPPQVKHSLLALGVGWPRLQSSPEKSAWPHTSSAAALSPGANG
jgi:hypothetical protein